MRENLAPSRRDDILAVLALLLIPTILFADVIFLGETFFYRDLTNYFYPAKKVVRDIILGGDFPFWNQWFSGGQPLAANPEFQVFYPLQALILLPDYALGYRLHLVLHIHLALAGMYLLLRSMALRVPSAFFGALAFGLSGFYLSYVNIPPFLFTLAWLPLVLLFFRRFILQPSARRFALASIFLGLQLLAAEPTTILQTGILALAYALFRGWQDGPGPRLARIGKRVLQTAGVVAMGSGIASVQVLPMLDLVRDTARAGGFNSFEMISTWSLPPVRAFELLARNLMGPAVDSGSLYWGRSAYDGRAPYLVSIHFGLFAAVMAVAGAVVPRRGRLPIVLAVVGSFLLAIGNHTPLLEILFDLGLFRSFRYPEKFILIAIFSLIVLAAVSLDRALAGDRTITRAALRISLVFAIASAALYAASWSDVCQSAFVRLWSVPARSPIEAMIAISRADWFRAAYASAIVSVLLLVLLKRGASRAWYAGALLFLLYDLGSHADSILERFPSSFLTPPPVVNIANGPSPQYRLVNDAQIDFDAGKNPPWAGSASFWLYRNGLFWRTPSAWGYRTVLDGDYDLTNLAPTRDLYEALLRTRDRGFNRTPEVYLAISNAGYVVRLREGDPRGFLVGAEVQTPVTISRRQYARYYFADQMVLIRDFDDFVGKTVRRGWSPRVAFVQCPPFQPARGAVLGVRERPNSTVLEVESAGRGYLVISITPHKYWRAMIDGQKAELIRTNVGYQGIVVPPGRHTIALRYSNPLIAAGAAISFLSLLGMSFVATAAFNRPRGTHLEA